MTRLFQLCEEPDPEDEQVEQARCDFLHGHAGRHSWEMEREALEWECSAVEVERERRARAMRRAKERRKAG